MARDVKYHPLVLGGEAALWTEEADTQDVPMKVILSKPHPQLVFILSNAVNDHKIFGGVLLRWNWKSV